MVDRVGYHIISENEVFGVPVCVCLETLHSLVVLLCYFFGEQSLLHHTEGGLKRTIGNIEVKESFGQTWMKTAFCATALG